MAQVTSDFLAGLFTNFRVVWEQAFFAATSAIEYDRFCTTISSDTDSESYNWLGTVPKMREWVDERGLSAMDSFNYSLKNHKYEVTVEVDRATITDDKYNSIRPRIAQLGQEAARYPAEIAAKTVGTGDANLCYDGSNFFDTNHSEGSSGTQSNKLTGTGTTLAQVRADFIAGRVAMRNFKDGSGRIMNLAVDMIYAPAEMQDVFEQLINTNIIALSSGTQQSNVLRGAADIVIDPYLVTYQGDTDSWYGFCTHELVKPIIYQLREAPEFVANDNPADTNVFMRDKFAYGVRARWTFGYSLWQLAFKNDN